MTPLLRGVHGKAQQGNAFDTVGLQTLENASAGPRSGKRLKGEAGGQGDGGSQRLFPKAFKEHPRR